ncbi:hypothetical protein LPB303_00165 [Polaribacter atrinae]|uniref:Uncharacterized protein n=1 Tax=Polaribacter atrinae TaxID=1333662 RepID=A0A176TH42_9FLAO|nr:hypothetical protein LPB303_00165 [Polaribacter atrinae]
MEVSVAATVTSNLLIVQGSNAKGDYLNLTITHYNEIGTYKTGNSISNINKTMYSFFGLLLLT